MTKKDSMPDISPFWSTPMQALINILKKLRSGASAAPATTTVAAVPMFISALIQVGYTFDADATTVTDWNSVITTVVVALGFTLTQDAPPNPPVAK